MGELHRWAKHSLPNRLLQAFVRRLDPRRSLLARAIYFICGLGMLFSAVAAIWVGGIARQNVLEQHVRRLSLETDQLSSDLGAALTARADAVGTVGALLGRNASQAHTRIDLARFYAELVASYPQLDWIAIADASGTVARSGSLDEGIPVDRTAWFHSGLSGPWIGVIDATHEINRVAATRSEVGELGDLSMPIHDDTGRVVGVIAAHLSWPRTPDHAQRLTDEADSPRRTEAYVLDDAGIVRIGPPSTRGRPWSGVRIDGTAGAALFPVFERLSDGRRVLASRAAVNAAPGTSPLRLQVLLSEPIERVYLRADAVARQILFASLLLGAVFALLGALGIRHLTRGLQRLTLSVAAAQKSKAAAIEVPDGVDEVSQLGAAFVRLIADLATERRELQTLAGELERRVAVRTREVERFAEESRYAAVARERLMLARALHDTLAHSIMAIISEIRLIRRLQMHEPGAVPGELARAEQLALSGLREARSAIAQMRAISVREAGLGPTLAREVGQFIDRTGVAGEFRSLAGAERFSDERSEVLVRMTQEALRNIERHARATRVEVTLEVSSGTRLSVRIEDNGVGFDPRIPKPGHYGLVGLYEQAELIGGSLQIESGMGLGTKLCISLPLSPVVFEPTTPAAPQGAAGER